MEDGGWRMVTNKKLLVIVCFFAAAPSLQAADPAVEEKIKLIRAKYSEIERELKDCRQVKRDLPDESAEGGELTAYFKESNLRKLSAKFFGETGKALEEYYFAENQVMFVLRIESHYTKPMSGVVKNRTEQRFYFADGKLFQWLGPDKKPHPMDAEAEKRGRELLADAKKYSTRIEDGK
jgi:hypothetical protein